ncbi:MAG: VPEID-CTERM sorting domain-containing protein [Pseudomonadota bacterium]
MRIGVVAAAGLILLPGLAFAGINQVVEVPEIDAMAGLGAMAAVGGIAALVWERRRNRDD